MRPFPGPGGRWQISREGGTEPIWSKDGKQLFYREEPKFWVADIRTEGGFSASKPRLLFKQDAFSASGPILNWDLWPDGKGFVMVKIEQQESPPITEMILVQNWLEELKQLVQVR